MRIELDGEWDQREIKAALRASRPVPIWVMALVLVALAAGMVLLQSGGDPRTADWIVLAVVIITILVAVAIAVPRQVRKLIDVPSLIGPVEGTLTDEALTMIGNEASSRAPWSHFRSMKFNGSGAALITKQRTCLLVLRNWFPDQASWDLFTSTVPDLIAKPTGAAALQRHDAQHEARGTAGGMRFGGSFNPAEHRPVIARMSPARRYGFGVIIIGALLAMLTFASAAIGAESDGFLPLALGAIVLGLLIVYGLPYLGTRMAQRGAMKDGVSGTADETGIDLVYTGGRSEVRWSAFVRAITTTSGVGLMMTDQAGVVIVRSWFDSDADWQRFTELVDRNLSGR